MEDYDRINDLPDDVLSIIISYLSGRELIATSLLCKRWRNLWTEVPKLVLDISIESDQDEILTTVFSRLSGPLTTVKIFNDYSAYYPNAKPWISRLSGKSISSLSLFFDTRYFYFNPCQFLNIEGLQELSLNGFNFLNFDPVDFSLSSLQLHNVSIDDKTLQTLISRATNLQQLCLYCCPQLKGPKIHSKTLKRLEINDCGDIQFLEIEAPNLAALKLYLVGSLRDMKLIVNSRDDSLKALSAYSIDLLKLAYNNGPEKMPKYLNNAKVFKRLLKLSLFTSLVRQAESLKWVLRKCTFLEEFSIRVYPPEFGNDRLHAESSYLGKEKTPSCLENHMKNMVIKDFEGFPMEMEFVEFILLKSLVLRKLVITGTQNCTADALESIKSMPRASSDLDIVTLPYRF